MSKLVEAIAPARLGTQFRWLLASSWVSNVGDGLLLASGPLLVASQTREPFVIALALFLQRMPWLLFGLLAGAVADRVDRRRIVLTVQLTRAVVLAAVAASIVADAVSTPFVLAVMFVLGTAETFADTTSQTLLPMLVHRDDLPVGNVRVGAGSLLINQLVGPSLGAALFAATPVAPFAVQTGCMLVSAALATRLRLPRVRDAGVGGTHIRRDIAEGLRWMWHHPPVRTLALTIVTFNVTYGAAWSVLVLYAIERLDAGEVGFGLLTTAVAVGGVVGTFLYGRLTARISLGGIMRIGLIIETVTHALLALTTRLPVALAVLFVFGIHAFVWVTTSTSVRQRAIPLHLQGRVGSAYLIGVQGGIVAGSAVGGAIAGAWGVVAPFWFAFAGSAVLVVLIWRQLPQIAHGD